MQFARRTDWDRSPGAFACAVAAARARGLDLIDLTESNPTRAALFDAAPLVALLGHPRGVAYVPDSLGHPGARAAVSGYYADRGFVVDPANVTLTASTSEAYGFLFKLLCERGDRVLVPAPSYPLFDFLAASEDVVPAKYPLDREHAWRLDLDAVERAIDERTRAIILVHPNNPTGSLVRRDEAIALERLAHERGVALVVDEVFGDYPLAELRADRLTSFAGRAGALTFVLSGLSKVLALPQLKLGWIATSGPAPLVREAIARLEVIADTYLSVATPVQLALPELLAARPEIQRAIRERTRTNLDALDAALSALGEAAVVRRLPVDAGWYAILEVPRIHTDDAWIELLLDRARAIVHPGYFFDLDRDGFLVVSLLPEPTAFEQAITRVLATVTEECCPPSSKAQAASGPAANALEANALEASTPSSGAPSRDAASSDAASSNAASSNAPSRDAASSDATPSGAASSDATPSGASLDARGAGLVERARDLAERAHRDQRRKGDTSVPYFVHLESAASILATFGVTDEVVLAAAYLHDLLEDQPRFEGELRSTMPEEVVAIVRCVTEVKLDEHGHKRPKEARFRDYLAVLGAGTPAARAALLVSFADQLDNARSLVASEAAGHQLLGRMNTAPDQKLRHLAELRALFVTTLTPPMLRAFDEAALDLAACVEAWRVRTGAPPT